MEELLSFYEKLPTGNYQLRLNTHSQKNTFSKLVELVQVNGIDLDFENLKWWSLLLQKIDLALFTSNELLRVIEINLTQVFNRRRVYDKYFINCCHGILYDHDGVLYQDIDVVKMSDLYQQQIRPSYYYNKRFIQELIGLVS